MGNGQGDILDLGRRLIQAAGGTSKTVATLLSDLNVTRSHSTLTDRGLLRE